MGTIWVLVANQAEASIYSTPRLRGPLTLEDTLVNDVARVHVRDLESDSPGRVHDRVGPGRHSMEPDVGGKEDGLRHFAKTVVNHLEGAHGRGSFQRLVLIAAPAFLGILRKQMPDPLAQIVIEEIPKDVIGQDAEQIRAQMS